MKKVKVYRTVSGETWDLVAYKVYGSEKYFHSLIRSNPNLLHIAIFDANFPIIVPDVKEEFVTEEAKKKLPPWKR